MFLSRDDDFLYNNALMCFSAVEGRVQGQTAGQSAVRSTFSWIRLYRPTQR